MALFLRIDEMRRESERTMVKQFKKRIAKILITRLKTVFSSRDW